MFGCFYKAHTSLKNNNLLKKGVNEILSKNKYCVKY